MKTKKILFVCKYNRFRSRVAEAYFRKINKRKDIEATSAGVLQGYFPLDKTQVLVSKKYGFDIRGKPRAMSMDLLNSQDKIIVVANDVPKEVFQVPDSEKRKYNYAKRLIFWNIPDVSSGKNIKQNEKVIKLIMKKVNELNKKLETEN